MLSNWIKFEDRQPQRDVDVLVCNSYRGKNIWIASWMGGELWTKKGAKAGYLKNVTHWQYLPDYPKEE